MVFFEESSHSLHVEEHDRLDGVLEAFLDRIDAEEGRGTCDRMPPGRATPPYLDLARG